VLVGGVTVQVETAPAGMIQNAVGVVVEAQDEVQL
jgi:hypothetical protein